MDNHADGAPLLPFFIFGTLVLFFFIWGAMHDIAHGDEGTAEWTVLAFCAIAFPIFYRAATRTLPGKMRIGWLTGTGVLIALFSVGAVASILRPKYVKRRFACAGLGSWRVMLCRSMV
jgi:hypothetical protein